jgi:hypothetical protein
VCRKKTISRPGRICDLCDKLRLDPGPEKERAAFPAQAERLIAAYVAPESNREASINDLLALFDGPQQREAQRLAVGKADTAVTARDAAQAEFSLSPQSRRRQIANAVRSGGHAGGSLHHKAELGHWLGHRIRFVCMLRNRR